MENEMVDALKTELGSTVSFCTSLDLEGVMKNVRIEGRLSGKYYHPKKIIVVPNSITILEDGKETPYQGELPRTIDSTLEEISNYEVLKEK